MDLHTIDFERPKLVIIHGWGGSFLEAIGRLRGLLDFDCVWHGAAFFVPKRQGVFVRQVLQRPEPDLYARALQRLIIARFLAAEIAGEAPGRDDFYRFPDERICDDFAAFGIPTSPRARRRRAEDLKAEALLVLNPLLPVLADLETTIRDEEAGEAFETEIRKRITAAAPSDGDALVDLLEGLRDMHETGGDLDTVASAVLYAHYLVSIAAQQGRELRYGFDYRFVFINYHEHLAPLAAYGETDLLMADLPIGAFPHFDRDARALAEKGIRILCFEDHHPYTAEQKAMLEKLIEDGVLGYLALSGPLQGEELAEEDLRCGADMVYEHVVRDQAWDCEGARELGRVAHTEDFVTDRNDAGRVLTDLIKGGICKVELAQELLAALRERDFMIPLLSRGWAQMTEAWSDELVELEDELVENAYVLHLERPPGDASSLGGDALGEGSDMPLPPSRGGDDGVLRVLVALAVHAKPGMPRMTVGRAIEFYAKRFTDADYVFYCYGSSLMVGRRLNHADFSMNLGALMPELGGEGDGGHGGAAVCRPESNAAYPKRILGRVSRTNFQAFARYLADRLSASGFPVLRVENRSVRSKEQMRKGGKNLAVVTAVALLIGVVLVLTVSAFKGEAVRRSNSLFMPHLVETDEAPQP